MDICLTELSRKIHHQNTNFFLVEGQEIDLTMSCKTKDNPSFFFFFLTYHFFLPRLSLEAFG